MMIGIELNTNWRAKLNFGRSSANPEVMRGKREKKKGGRKKLMPLN